MSTQVKKVKMTLSGEEILGSGSFRIEIKLNLGSGYRPREGFVNIDNREECKPDLLCDVVSGLPFDDDSVDYVLATDFLEHVPAGKVVSVIEDIYRVLKPGGILEHLTPSTDGRGAFSDPHHVSFWNAASWLYYTDDEHRRLYGITAKFVGQSEDHVTNEKWGIVHTHGILHAIKGDGYAEPCWIDHFDGKEDTATDAPLNPCQQCGSDSAIETTALGDERQQFVCGECGHEWEAPI